MHTQIMEFNILGTSASDPLYAGSQDPQYLEASPCQWAEAWPTKYKCDLINPYAK